MGLEVEGKGMEELEWKMGKVCGIGEKVDIKKWWDGERGDI